MITNDLVLVGEYGSVAQGTATADSDHDYMAVFIETEAQVIGLEETETKRVSDAKQGEKSAPGSSDTTYHSLRKFCKLAAGGNPTIGSILFLPQYEEISEIGKDLILIRDAFVSRKAGEAYLGYMTAQIKAFDETGRKNRVELVEQYGYDIKFGYHAYRLGVQGLTMMQYGEPELPLRDDNLAFAKRVRAGQVSKEGLMNSLEILRRKLSAAIDMSSLPAYADTEAINAFLVEAHQRHWRNAWA